MNIHTSTSGPPPPLGLSPRPSRGGLKVRVEVLQYWAARWAVAHFLDLYSYQQDALHRASAILHGLMHDGGKQNLTTCPKHMTIS